METTIHSEIKQLMDAVDANKDSETINSYIQNLSSKIGICSNNAYFYKLPMKIITDVLNAVNLGGTDNYHVILSDIVKHSFSEHPKEPELLLEYINAVKASFSFPDYIFIIKSFTNGEFCSSSLLSETIFGMCSKFEEEVNHPNNRYTDVIQEKENEILNLKEKINNYKKQITDFDSLLNQKNSEIETIKAQLNEKNEQEVKDLKQEINNLQQQMKEKENELLITQEDMRKIKSYVQRVISSPFKVPAETMLKNIIDFINTPFLHYGKEPCSNISSPNSPPSPFSSSNESPFTISQVSNNNTSPFSSSNETP